MPDFTIEGLTEEQTKAMQSEIDRRVNQAVNTTTETLTKKLTTDLTNQYEQKYQNELAKAIADAKQDATMTEQEKFEKQMQELQQQQVRFKREQTAFNVERKLRDAGIADDAIKGLTPLFSALDDTDAVNTYVDNFVNAQKTAVDSALELQKQQLASSATPPFNNGSGTDGEKDVNTQIAAARKQWKEQGISSHEQSAMEAQMLINASFENGI